MQSTKQGKLSALLTNFWRKIKSVYIRLSITCKKIQDIRVSFSVSPAGKSFRNYKFCLHLVRKQFANKKRSCEKVLFFVSRPGTSATSIPLKKVTRCKASEATLRKQAAVRIASKRALGKFYPYIHFICLSSMSWYWCRGRHLRHRMHFYTQLKYVLFYYIDIGIMLKLKRKKNYREAET